MNDNTQQAEIIKEQEYLDFLYGRLEELKSDADIKLKTVRKAGGHGTPQTVGERDAFAAFYEDRIAQLSHVDEKLMFGKLILDSGKRHYIGRIGMSDDDSNPILLDWRAPEAGAFYQATALDRMNVAKRRHIMTKDQEITALEDEVLDTSLLKPGEVSSSDTALLAAITAPKTGTMGDIVATIHAEQDQIIRSDHRKTLVVQGAPGTGKTAIALHRAAYLLYNQRENIANNGMLILGPSSMFLTYIENVLPSLGETGVVMGTVDQLYPAPGILIEEPSEKAAKTKGSLKMLEVMKRAVTQRETVPAADKFFDVGGNMVQLTRKDFQQAQNRVRISKKPHNEVWAEYAQSLMNILLKQHIKAEAKKGMKINEETEKILLDDIRSSREVRMAINLSWLPLTPDKLLQQFFANEARVFNACQGLFTEAEARSLLRVKTASFTQSDIPILAELHDLLGDMPGNEQQQLRAKQQREKDLENARMALENSHLDEHFPQLSPEQVADQFSLEERAVASDAVIQDRDWTFKHVVIDEAQELSPMQWHLVFSRCPSKSMTILGDVAQTSSAVGTHSWDEVLKPFVDDRYQLEELSINYRTPARIMDVANKVAKAAGFETKTPKAVREGDYEVEYIQTSDLVKAANLQLVKDKAEFSLGQSVIIAKDTTGYDYALTPKQAKGLEFDSVIVVEPSELFTAAGKVGDLYVSLTRASQKLTIIHDKPLPAGF
ncbi:MAG: AAA family ATPase [Micrococcaceae bacterium]